MTVIPYILYLLLVAAHVVVLRDLTTIFAAPLHVPALLVLLVALYKDDVQATWFGFLVGLVMAAGGPPSQLGWQALFMAALALGSCFVRVRLNLDSLNAKLLFVLGGVMLHNLILLIVDGTDGILFYIASSALAGAVYTTVVAWLFFMIKEGRLTIARVRALF